MTRDLAIAIALVILVALAFYGALGNHGGRAAPPAGATLPAGLSDIVDPHVTQLNIRSTIPGAGGRTPSQVKDELATQQGVSVRDFELDHIIPLDLGGAPLDRRNLQLVP